MRIQAIDLKDLRSHVSTRITGLDRINWFVGQNATGKSSILDAIQLGLTGTCRGLDEGGRGAEALVTVNGGGPSERTRCLVSLEFDTGHIDRRFPGDGPRSASQVMADQILGRPALIARSIVDTGRFLSLPSADQKNLLTELLGASATRQEVETALGDAAPTLFAWFNREEYRAADFTAIEKQYREVRPTIKASIAAAAQPDVDWSVFAEDIRRMDLSKAEIHLSTLRDQISSSGAAALASTEATLAARVKQLEADIELGTEAAKVVGSCKEAVANVEHVMEAESKTGTDLEGGRWASELIKTHGVITAEACPVCLRVWTENTRERHLRRLAGATAANDSSQEKIRKLASHLVDLKLQLREAERRVAAKDDNVREWGQACQDLKVVREKIEKTHAGDQAKQERLQQLSNYVQLKRATSKRTSTDRAALEAKLAHVEKIIEVFGPNGLRVKMITDRFQALLDIVVRILNPFGIRVSVRTDPFQILVLDRPAALLSQSEQLIVSIAFQLSLARLAGVSIVCLDGVEILDPDNRVILSHLLADAEAPEQVFLACTLRTADKDFVAPKVPGWAFYLVRCVANQSSVVRA